ncbi:MAG TPA: response regulator transcription factor [Gaiellaceae bacterium]|nr:response regulator transcription factor [Gaiellaceae bacterium]
MAAVISEADQVVARLRAGDVALAVLDVALGGAASLLQPIRYAHPELTVVTVGPRDWAHVALRNGASGFVVDDVEVDAFVEGVRSVVASSDFTLVGADPADDAAVLSAREHEVVSAAARGLTNKQIAAELLITEQTVKFHLGNAFRKLGVTNRAQAAVAALRLDAA